MTVSLNPENDRVSIIQSPNDRKKYKYLKLANSMKVLLIHDPDMAELCKVSHSL